MSEQQLFHFWRQRPKQPPKWWCSRKDKDGTMFEFISDLRKKYNVETDDGRNYVITDKEEIAACRAEGLDK